MVAQFSGREQVKYEVLYIAAYVVPAALVWAVLGLLFWVIGNTLWFLPMIALAYAALFGAGETFGVSLLPIGSSWQVPASWVKGRQPILQALIWGSLLGPGFVTRNPYAGIWLLLPLTGIYWNLSGAVIAGILIGIAHGVARAMGILRNHQCRGTNLLPTEILNARLRWRLADGIALLVGAGLLLPYCLSLIGFHL